MEADTRLGSWENFVSGSVPPGQQIDEAVPDSGEDAGEQGHLGHKGHHAPYMSGAVHGGLRPLLLGFKDSSKTDVGAFQRMHILDIPGGIRGDLGCPDWERWGVPPWGGHSCSIPDHIWVFRVCPQPRSYCWNWLQP